MLYWTQSWEVWVWIPPLSLGQIISPYFDLVFLTCKMRVWVGRVEGIFQLRCIVILQMPKEMPILFTTCFNFFFTTNFATIFFGQSLTLIALIYFSLECSSVWVGPKPQKLTKMFSPINKHGGKTSFCWFQRLRLLCGKEKDICYIFHHVIQSLGIDGAS